MVDERDDGVRAIHALPVVRGDNKYKRNEEGREIER